MTPSSNIDMALNSEFHTCKFLMDCARESRDEDSIIAACYALQSCSAQAVSSESIQRKYCRQNYHEFVREMLSDSHVSNSLTLVKVLYNTFQMILEPYTQENLEDTVHTPEYIHFFVRCFVRDTATFKNLTADIVSATFVLFLEMKGVELISVLKDLGFHTEVSNVFNMCSTPDTVCLALELLGSTVEKYCEYLELIRPFQETKLPYVLLEKAKVLHSHPDFSDTFDESFSTNFYVIMKKFTTDKNTLLELFEDGYLEQLLEVFDSLSNIRTRGSIIYTIGDIAYALDSVKNLLLEKKFYASLFSILHIKMDMLDPTVVIACCEVLHILALGDDVKQRYVKSGCTKIIHEIVSIHGDSSSALRLLTSISDINIMNRQPVITTEILKVLMSVLRSTKNTMTIRSAVLVLLDNSELDLGAIELRELGVVETLKGVISDPSHCNQLPLLETCGMELLEKLFLYTLSKNCHLVIPRTCSDNHLSYWPPNPICEVCLDGGFALFPLSSSSSHGPRFKSKTPTAPELSDSGRQELAKLGVNPSRQIFRVGRLYGTTYNPCQNCEDQNILNYFSFLIIRPLSLTIDQYQALIDCGWYRMGRVNMHRFNNCHNIECYNWETRISAKTFDHKKHRSNRRLLKRMPEYSLSVETCHVHFSKEAFDLYNNYNVKRHNDPLKSEESYCEHVVNTPIAYQVMGGIEYGTFHLLYRLDGKLVAVSVVDVIPKGIISVYMWYDVSKDIAKYSLGKYSILKEIEMVRDMSKRSPSMEYYYLQGWNGKNKKLGYKGDYEPEEFYCPCIVTDWVCGLECVQQYKTKAVEEETDAKELEQLETDRNKEEQPPQKKLKLEPKVSDIPSEENEGACVPISMNHIESKAFPLDMKRYKANIGKCLDITKVVICLNYSKFMHLSDLFEHVNDTTQKNIMETRIKDLYVALSPELRNQLVIDMMVASI